MLIDMINWPLVAWAAEGGGNGGGGGQGDTPAAGNGKGDGDTPAASQQQGDGDPAEAPPEDTPAEEPIRDPLAKAQAEAEKWQRLHSKSEDRIKALEAQMATMQDSQKQAVQQQIDEIKSEMQQQLDATNAALMQAKREKAVLGAGLPETAAQFITAESDEEIATQVAQLKELAPAQDGGTPLRQPRTGNPASQTKLTRKDIEAMTPEEYRRRRDEVLEALGNLD